MRPHLEQLAAKYGLSNITFNGYLQGMELTTLVRDARCSIMPSEWYENSPLSILESLALGTPVIGSRIGGIPELINDGEDGLLFPAGDVDALAACIRQLWEHPRRAREMGLKGRRKILSRYTPEQHYEQVFPLYKRLVNL